MSDLTEIQGLLARGDKENAVVQLAAILLKDRNDVDAWLLMGEMIDDPSRKKDCYRRVLRLAPQNLFALTRLQELESPAPTAPIASTENVRIVTKRSPTQARQLSNFIANQSLTPTGAQSNDDKEVVSYFVLGLLAVLLVLYVIVTGNFASYGNVFCVGLFFLGLSAGVVILLGTNKNRG